MSPLDVLMKIGKNTRITTMAWFERGETRPNQALKIGARAMIGTALSATANGVMISFAVRNRVTRRAATTPKTTPNRSPVTMM